RALEEVKHLVSRYGNNHGVTLLRSVDQILDHRYFKTFVPGLAKQRIALPIYYEVKTNLSREQVRLLAAANVKLLQPGIESLSTPILQLMRKGCTMLQNVQLLKWCAEDGIVALWNLLYGFPGETAEDYNRMAEVISTVSHLQPPSNIYRVRLVRFSPYIAEPESFGMTRVRPIATYRNLYPDISDEVLAMRAFRFDFDFADGRDLDYCRPALTATKRWMRSSGAGALVGFVTDEGMLVWDERKVAQDKWTCIDQRLSSILTFCDRIRSLQKIRQFLAESERREVSFGETEELVGLLEERRLLLREENLFLSIVVNHNTDSPPQPPPGITAQVLAPSPG
ncbi:MAG: hypothetical protein ETSY2_19180, partial [Candidatus Entotheonella gemina]